MRGRFPLISCLTAVVLGLGAGVWPSIRAEAFHRPDPKKMASATASAFADKKWPAPTPGTWTVPPASADGLPPVISRIATQEKVVFLTIDDGYEYDAEFVGIVRREQVPILTFLTTSYLPKHGPYFWAMKHAGSPIENHTVSHPNMVTLSAEGQQKEICDASASIEKAYGRRPTIFRAPFGSSNDVTRQAAKACGIKSLLFWTAEFYNGTKSPRGTPDDFQRGDGATGFKPGDIVLMHYRKGLAGQFTTLLGWIRAAGFTPAAIENYLPVSLGGNAPG
ncbi:MAG: polysaccharide deacetylase family protein [Streptosporangiaceae bacterium]